MRVKELRIMLDKLPDDCEVVIRAQTKQNEVRATDDIKITAANFKPASTKPAAFILNPEKPLRTMQLIPNEKQPVLCTECINFHKLNVCISRARSCDTCYLNCPCKGCRSGNPSVGLPMKDRPNWKAAVCV